MCCEGLKVIQNSSQQPKIRKLGQHTSYPKMPLSNLSDLGTQLVIYSLITNYSIIHTYILTYLPTCV
jgi:hypothetical protein